MTEFAHISPQQTLALSEQQDIAIVDIRDEQSFISGHMPKAFHLTNGTMHQFTQQTEYETPVVVVCYHGISSQQAAQYLIHQGFENVYSMDGGFEAWRHNFPVETGE